MNRWENSDYYLRTFSPLLQAAVPRIRRFDFTVDQMTALFTTQLILLPLLSGYAYVPIHQTLIRTGLPYATQPGSVFLRYITAAGTQVATLGSWSSAIGVLTGSGTNNRNAYSLIGWNGVNSGLANAINFPTDDSATGYGSKGLALGTGAGNPTVTAAAPGSTVTLIFSYYLLPTYPETAGGPITPPISL